jgi:DNA-binding GntR family transcriptional regulator
MGETRLLKPINKVPAEAQATEALRDSIVAGAFAPGERLTEVKLAANFGLSRATVRTALHQLAKEGLIVQTPYTGWAVVTLTAQSAWELYTLRAALEGLAARLTTEALDVEGRTTLSEVFAQLAAACARGDKGAIADADFDLHKTIVALAGHSRLALQYRIVEQQVRMYIRQSDGFISDPWEIVRQHRVIVDPILSGDAEAAAQASQEHNLSEGQKLVGYLDASPHGYNPHVDASK